MHRVPAVFFPVWMPYQSQDEHTRIAGYSSAKAFVRGVILPIDGGFHTYLGVEATKRSRFHGSSHYMVNMQMK